MYDIEYNTRTMIETENDSIHHKMDTESVMWYAMCAYRREEKVKKRLDEAGIANFVPMRYIVKEKRGGKTKVLIPAIPNLIFVRSTKTTLQEFKVRTPYLQYITRKMGLNTEKIVVPDNQMNNFIDIAQHYEEDLTYYRPEEIEMKSGINVRIHGGTFDGFEGTFVKIKGKRSKRLVVSIDGISAITVEIHPDLIEIL